MVLAGGAARGAYEIGVVEYIVEEVSKQLGYDVPLDVLTGTSVGAINACMLAAFADEPRGRAARMAAVWTGLEMKHLLKPTTKGVLQAARGLLGKDIPAIEAGALFHAEPLAQFLKNAIPFERIDTHLRAGLIKAVAVSTTQIATGRTIVFVQRRNARALPWAVCHNVVPRAVRLRTVHALASAAVPLMFPPVNIDGRFYCDGGLRQNIPLSPARRLGATAVIVINPKHRPAPGALPELERSREESFPSPLFLIGKSLNALLLDRIDNDIARLDKINDILDAGTRCYGAQFAANLNRELGYPPDEGLTRLDALHIRTSANIGELAAEYVRQPSFEVPGLLGRVMKRLAHGAAMREADLLSYVLFDGQFAGRLIELGRADAREHHDELCQLFEANRLASGRKTAEEK